MKPILLVGTSIVNVALIFYSLFIFQVIKHRKISSKVLLFLTTGVILDVTATVCMILGSSKGIFTLHGVLGYSSLLAMLIDCIITWRTKLNLELNADLPKSVHKYSIFAYSWWIFAYITGAVLVFLFR